MTQCVECSSFSLRDAGQMARQGCGVCAHDAAYSYYSALRERECSRFIQAAVDVIEKRKEWLDARN